MANNNNNGQYYPQRFQMGLFQQQQLRNMQQQGYQQGVGIPIQLGPNLLPNQPIMQGYPIQNQNNFGMQQYQQPPNYGNQMPNNQQFYQRQQQFQQPQQQYFQQQQQSYQRNQGNFYESEVIQIKDFSMRVLKTKYISAKLIGEGSFAKVYSGVDSETGERVAIKKIDKRKFDTSYLELIDSEIAVLSELNNEHIIQFKDLFSEGDYIYIVTELCDLGDLEVFIKKNFQLTNKKMPEQLVKIFSYQILLAFLGIGDKEIIHRDMKLSNILITSKLHVKVADFGLAKSGNQKDTDSVGTPMTMAPEVLYNKDYDAKCDVWSMGCMIYEMLEGRPPFQPSQNGGLAELKRLVLLREIVFRNPEISNDAKDLIDQMLIVEHKDRISWNDMFTHRWFAQCVSEGDPFIQKVCNDYQLLSLNSQPHLDPEFAEVFGFLLREYLNNCVIPLIIELKKSSSQLMSIAYDYNKKNPGLFQKQYQDLALVDESDETTKKSKLYQQILNNERQHWKLASLLFNHTFTFKFKQISVQLPLTRLCKDHLSQNNDRIVKEIEGFSPSLIIEELINSLLETCELAMDVDYEIFKTSFAQIVSFLNRLIDNKTGFVTEIKVNESEQNLSQKDSDRIMLIDIEKAYLDEKPIQNGMNQQQNIQFIETMIKTKYEQEKNRQEILDKTILLGEIVFGYQQEVSKLR